MEINNTKRNNIVNWDEVFDYESDEFTVTLLDKYGFSLGEFIYSHFTRADFIAFKTGANKKRENILT